jgi:hypothetical protein
MNRAHTSYEACNSEGFPDQNVGYLSSKAGRVSITVWKLDTEINFRRT